MADNPQADSSRGEQLLGQLYAIMMLAYLGWVLWQMTMPPDRRTMLRVKLLRSSGRAMRVLARRAAAASMRRELATGVEQYTIPCRLATLAARIDAAYESARRGFT